MKKKFMRILSAVLVAMMLIPVFATFTVSAEVEMDDVIDISDIVNVYELNQLNAAPNEERVNGAKDKEPTPEDGVLASKAFATSRDKDKYIYIGPCPDPATYTSVEDYNFPIVYWYNKDGKYTAFKRMGELSGNVVDRFDDGSVILKVMVFSSYKFAAIKVPTTYADFMLVTCERPFTVDEYFAYAEAQGWELEGTSLRPAPPQIAEEAPEGYEGFWNYFSLGEDFVAPSTQKESANKYKTSEYISVTEGDVITIGAVSTKEPQPIVYAYSNETVPGKSTTDGPVVLEYKEVKKLKKDDVGIDFVENIGYDYAIYSYTVGEGVSYVKVSMPASTYGNGDVLVTKNQSFDGEQFRQALEIPELSSEAKDHVFYGKNALFVGDSIFLGEYDTPTSFSNPSTGFARRFALATGLNPTVFAADGATIGKTGKSNVKYAYDLFIKAYMSKKNYDMIIFQGGINDARQGVAVGEILPVETEREVLAEKDRTKTFAGALQLMFFDALNKKEWVDAEFYYVASYKTNPEVVNNVDMSLYYAQAKALCEIYGIHYIDLYNDVDLYNTFDYNNAELFADDKFTPLSATYDVLFPTVLRLFNAYPWCTDHIYSNDCDETCNNCGRKRTIEHTYDNGCDNACNICEFTRNTGHLFVNDCDTECAVCGFTRSTEHAFVNDCDTVCKVCQFVRVTEHVFDNDCDAVCNVCAFGRKVEHTFENACDTMCNICGFGRITGHVFENSCDATCNVCNIVRMVTHSYGSENSTACSICGEEKSTESTVAKPNEETTPESNNTNNSESTEKENIFSWTTPIIITVGIVLLVVIVVQGIIIAKNKKK